MAQLNKKGLPTEDQEQSWLVAWFRKTYPQHRIFAIPNGGGRSKSEGVLLKATGVTAGVLDLMIPAPSGHYHGLFIEMKVQKGGRVSPEQKDWIDYLTSVGYCAKVCNGFDEARRCVDEYMSAAHGLL
jgi:hypothetical protein